MVEAPQAAPPRPYVPARRSRRCAIWVVGIAAAVSAFGLAFAYSGLYSVAATYPDRSAVTWFLGTTMDRSVQRHAAGTRAPALDSPEMFRTGFQHYREMCVECHGAPGVPPAELAQGLNPSPPPLVESAGDWEPSELFWITKNGVRMTGMPAWGPTHSDDKIWAIVAFVRRLPKLSEAEYRALDRQVPALPED